MQMTRVNDHNGWGLNEPRESSEARMRLSVARMTSSTTRSGRTEMIAIGLRAVRAAAAVKRGLAGQELGDTDQVELTLLEDALHRSAEAARYGRTSTSVSRPRHLASVSLAIAAASRPRQTEGGIDAPEVGSTLDALAEDVSAVARGATPKDAEALVAFMAGLVALARNETASAGETLKRSES